MLPSLRGADAGTGADAETAEIRELRHPELLRAAVALRMQGADAVAACAAFARRLEPGESG